MWNYRDGLDSSCLCRFCWRWRGAWGSSATPEEPCWVSRGPGSPREQRVWCSASGALMLSTWPLFQRSSSPRRLACAMPALPWQQTMTVGRSTRRRWVADRRSWHMFLDADVSAVPICYMHFISLIFYLLQREESPRFSVNTWHCQCGGLHYLNFYWYGRKRLRGTTVCHVPAAFTTTGFYLDKHQLSCASFLIP